MLASGALFVTTTLVGAGEASAALDPNIAPGGNFDLRQERRLDDLLGSRGRGDDAELELLAHRTV